MAHMKFPQEHIPAKAPHPSPLQHLLVASSLQSGFRVPGENLIGSAVLSVSCSPLGHLRVSPVLSSLLRALACVYYELFAL